LPLGMPKPRTMPADFNVATIRSALFMAGIAAWAERYGTLPSRR
jgi:hypothetical protein